jgi:hypothetical protein
MNCILFNWRAPTRGAFLLNLARPGNLSGLFIRSLWLLRKPLDPQAKKSSTIRSVFIFGE